jgi:hypothetical protein
MKKINYTLKSSLLTFAFSTLVNLIFATGEPSTYFNIFVPPNNDFVKRDVCLILTAIYDSTSFSIIDDGMDGDTDDSKDGVLMAGQSYVLYIRDNGINDDAKYASGGTLKQDGDYFIINSNKIMYASQSTNSDWQHDWVPSTNKSGIGEKFIIYSPKVVSSNNDLNAFAYENNTQITIRKISFSPTLISGYTNVDMYSSNIVVQRNINVGQDLIYSGIEGRNLLVSGETYVVESNKPITLQYGALFGNERDGGGYVPSSNGSSAGDLFYFGVPFQSGSSGEQEVRIVSLDNANNVSLERYSSGSWVSVKNWVVNSKKAVDWVGRNSGNVNYPSVFRVKCSAGKRVSVFEANWLETGNPGTSDIGTMCSSFNGTASGNDFLIYLAPPGNEQNVKNPFTGNLFGQQLTHAYIFASNDTCNVSVKDSYTNGLKFNKSFTILPNRYVDCFLTLAEWRSIYNGTGTTAGGPERPYLSIQSDNSISVMNTNFNDNWMMYFGSSLEQSFGQTSVSSKEYGIPGDTISVTSTLEFNSTSNIDSASIVVNIGSGVKVISSTLNDIVNSTTTAGNIVESDNLTTVYFPMTDTLYTTNTYQIVTEVTPQVMYNNGDLIPDNTVVGIESVVTGKIDGILQQSSSSVGLKTISSNSSNLIFQLAPFNTDVTNSWTANSVDINGDGWEDLFVTDKDANKPNIYYKNNGNKTFTKTTINKLTTDLTETVCASWGDFNNDGKSDVLVLNDTKKPNSLFINNGSQIFQKVTNSPVSDHPGYFHSGSFVDYDNDGWLDIFACNFMPTKFNELFHNNQDGTFSQITNSPIVMESNMSLGATWADFDNDGDKDLFIPNDNNQNNSFFVNNGNGTFTKNTSLIICNDPGKSVGSCWGDINNDGWLDLFVANSSEQNNFLYINNKNGDFVKVTAGPVVNDGGHSHGCAFVDIDNDMDLDLYVTNDYGIKYLYLNDGIGNYSRKKDEVLEANYGKSMGQAWFDADKDGDEDLFVATHSGQKNNFFLNNGNSNNWSSIKLVGTISNRDAIGARVAVKSGGVWQQREINSQSGLGGQSSIRCKFGLASNANIDSVIVKWPSGIVQVLLNFPTNSFSTITEPLGALVKGEVYFDSNNNCIKDSAENTVSNIKLNFDNSYAITNSNGLFTSSSVLGQHNVKLLPQGYWYYNCDSISYSVNSLNDTIRLSVPVFSSAIGPDLKASMALTPMRRGFSNQIQLNVENIGSTLAINTEVKLKMTQGMILTSSEPMYQFNNANEYTWIIDTILPGHVVAFNLLNLVQLNKTVGDEIDFSLTASTNSDLNLANNSVIEKVLVVGAIDPNELHVFPKGEGAEGFIKRETKLKYTILFQNVGTYLASNVQVKSQLPAELDYTNILEVYSSHSFSYQISEKGLFSAYFENINLPDSTSDSEASNGFISFIVPLIETINYGTLIENKADIYFDFEEPISTNKVKNTVVLNSQREALLVYPNPAKSTVRVQLVSSKGKYQSDNLIVKYRIYNSMGTLIVSANSLDRELSIDVNQFIPGIYYLIATDLSGKNLSTKIIVTK